MCAIATTPSRSAASRPGGGGSDSEAASADSELDASQAGGRLDHWTARKLASHLGINHMLVARARKRANLKPHRIKRYIVSDDPDYEMKAADVIGTSNRRNMRPFSASTRGQRFRPLAVSTPFCRFLRDVSNGMDSNTSGTCRRVVGTVM